MPTRRGRPPSFDRAAVLDQLMMLFWERGYEATSQADMIERAGISSSSLYNTFGNKPDVLAAVLERYTEMSYGLLGSLREGERGLEDVEAFFDFVIGTAQSGELPPGCLMVRTMTELGGRTDPFPTEPYTTRYHNQVEDALRAALGRAADRGEVAAASVDAKASLATSVYLGALAVAISDPDRGVAMLETGRQMVAGWRVP